MTQNLISLDGVFAVPPLDQTELLRTAAIAERRSEHLLARLIVREAESRNLVVPPTTDFISHPGAGVVAKVRSAVLGPWAGGESADETRTIVVGNRALIDAQHIELPAAIEQQVARMEQSGATTLLVAVDDRILGAIGVRDAVREESRSVLVQLKEAGVRSFALLTGDRAEPAQFVANSLGLIDDVEA